MKVHFLCDHKWRDLPTVSAMRMELEKLGITSTAASSKDTFALLPVLRPNALVLNHMYSERRRDFARALRAKGVKIIVLPTEGKGEPAVDRMVWGDFNDYSEVDLFLAWNRKSAEKLIELGRLTNGRVELVGCTRYDYYRDPWARVTLSRQEFCERHGLDPARPIAAWTTKFGYARVHDNPSLMAAFEADFRALNVWRCYDDIGFDWRNLPRIHQESRVALSASVMEAAKARPNIQFLIKPHPTEEKSFYERRMAEHGLRNVTLIFGEYIWDVLQNSDVTLQQRCSTAVESWMIGKPTIELKMREEADLVWPELEACSPRAHDAEELVAAIDAVLLGDTAAAPETQRRREALIEEFAWKVDGQRSRHAALAIAGLLSESRPAKPVSPGDFGLSWRASMRITLRYGLGVRSSQSIACHMLSRGLRMNMGPRQELDKEVTRFDVMRYTEMIGRRCGFNASAE